MPTAVILSAAGSCANHLHQASEARLAATKAPLQGAVVSQWMLAA